MSATESLRKDHQILRAKLKLLEAAMQMLPESNFVLRELCWSLARMLNEHIRHETDALQPYRNRIQALTQERMAKDHADQQVILRDINALLLSGVKAPVNKVVPPLLHLIEELREHMEEEEQEVFPMVDRMTSEEAQMPSAPAMPFITETMTVNHILRIHPRAREVFQTFHVDCDADGCHCLDELYWRRGIDVAALLHELNETVGEQTVAEYHEGGAR